MLDEKIQGMIPARFVMVTIFLVYIAIDENLNESTTVCSLRSLRSLALNKYRAVDH